MSEQAEDEVQYALHEVWLAIHNRRFEESKPDSIYRGVWIAEEEIRRYCREHELAPPSTCPRPHGEEPTGG